jgi:hypothetical protein
MAHRIYVTTGTDTKEIFFLPALSVRRIVTDEKSPMGKADSIGLILSWLIFRLYVVHERRPAQ